MTGSGSIIGFSDSQDGGDALIGPGHDPTGPRSHLDLEGIAQDNALAPMSIAFNRHPQGVALGQVVDSGSG
jgi:hypothetical protein